MTAEHVDGGAPLDTHPTVTGAPQSAPGAQESPTAAAPSDSLYRGEVDISSDTVLYGAPATASQGAMAVSGASSDGEPSPRLSVEVSPGPEPDGAARSTSAKRTRKTTNKPKPSEKFMRPRSNARAASDLPSPWKECRVHRPTLGDIQSHSFSDYIRHIVLKAACLWISKKDSHESDDDSEMVGLEDWMDAEEVPLSEGMAKVCLPDGFWSEDGIHHDRTGRGEAWQAGRPCGDYVLRSPIEQHVRGLAGVYEFIFTEKSPMTIAQFREKADKYRVQLVGSAFEQDELKLTEHYLSDELKNDSGAIKKIKDTTAIRIAELERLFWKRLGPTMPPAWYGADEEGSFFGDDDASGWAINKLDSCLHLLSNVPGVTTPYLYLGMWGSCFAAHTEDVNLLSINYLHAGAPKLWYAVAPGRDAKRFEELAAFHFRQAESKCKEFLRHKRYLLSPRVLQKAGIPFTFMIQYPGEAMITFPGGYHFGFNSGYNVAEATNFGVDEWIPYGLRAKVCLCRPDSVRIDMKHFIIIFEQYQKYVQRHKCKGRRWQALSFKAWAHLKLEAEKTSAAETAARGKRKRNLSDQQQRGEFYIEVVNPLFLNKSLSKDNGSPPKGSRGAKGRRTLTRDWGHESTLVWHLARPVDRRHIGVQSNVLILVPSVAQPTNVSQKKKKWTRWDASSDEEEEDQEVKEQCFAGTVSEISDGHVRVHLEGHTKSDDIWTSIDSPKLFLDGGRWKESEDTGLPERHYWEISDSMEMSA